MIIVDRIEEGIAVVFFGDIRRDIPLSELPEGVHEGSVLLKQSGGFCLDTSAEEKRRRELAERTRRIFQRK